MLGHALSLLPLLALALALVSVSAGKPPVSEKAETARWLAHLADWGTISTISVHLKGVPFGQGISFVDGTEDNSTGNFYFYTTEMDTSVQDTMVDPRVSFSTTMAGAGMCPTKKLDPENPLCAKLVVSGTFGRVTDADEEKFAHDALFSRHPEMKNWPADHDWNVYKIDVTDVYLMDTFGGAAIITVEDYFAANPKAIEQITERTTSFRDWGNELISKMTEKLSKVDYI